MSALAITSNPLARNVFAGFQNWASTDLVYKPTYKKIHAESFVVITDALQEMPDYRPTTYESWWNENEQRYTKTVKYEQVRYMRELMYTFLTKYVRGTLNEHASLENGSRKPKQKVKKARRG